jgi:hypothetical protein
MAYEAEAGQRRWLLKAIRESSGELFGQFHGLKEASLRWRPSPDEWCLKEVAGHLRDAESLYQRQVELIAHEREPRLPHEPVDVLPFERDYRDGDALSMLRGWESARDETVWTLRMLDEDDWARTGIHRYRGPISIYDIIRDLHQHDLEHLYQARRLRAAVSL